MSETVINFSGRYAVALTRKGPDGWVNSAALRCRCLKAQTRFVDTTPIDVWQDLKGVAEELRDHMQKEHGLPPHQLVIVTGKKIPGALAGGSGEE